MPMPVLIKFSFMHSTALVGNLPHEKAGLTPPLPPPLLSPVFPCEPNTVCNLTANWSCSWGLINFLSAWQDLHGRHMTTHYTIRITQLTQRTRHSTQTTGTNETHSGGGGGWWVSAWTGIPADHLLVWSPLPLSPAQPPAANNPDQQPESHQRQTFSRQCFTTSQDPTVPWIERRKKMDSPCHTTAQRYARRDDDYTGRQVGRRVQVSPPHTHHRYQRCTAMRGREGERRTEKWNTTL